MAETRIGFVQFEPVFGNREENLRIAARLVEKGREADLLVMPELATTGYVFADAAEAARHAEPAFSGPTSAWLADLAARFDVTLVIGYPEKAGGALYNSCLLARPDGSLFNYRKLHLFSREKQLFSPGDAAPPVIDTPAGRVGLMICYDWFFPEIARMLALRGAQIIAHPVNLVLDYCQKAMYARCVENRVFAVTANRVGTEARAGRTIAFKGASQVLDAQGATLACAPAAGEAVAVATIDPAAADNKCVSTGADLFGDRRPEFYGLLAQPGLGG